MVNARSAIAALVVTLSALASAARADVRFEQTDGYLPSGYESVTSFFDASAPLFSAAGSVLETGRTRPCPTNAAETMISSIGPMSGSKLVRSQPVLTNMSWPAAAAYVDGAAEPTVILAGDAIEVYAGSPPTRRSHIANWPGGEIKALAVTRYVDADDFDIAAVSDATFVLRIRNGSATRLWYVGLPAANSVAVIPASGLVSELIVAVNDGFTVVYDLEGNVVFTTQSGGQEVVAGSIGAASTPVFVVRDPWVGVTAYATTPPAPLWHRPDLEGAAVLIGDVSLDGINEILVGTERGVLQRLNPDGTNYGNAIALPGANGSPNFEMRLIESRVAGLSVPQFIVVADPQYYYPNDVQATYVFAPNLLTALDVEPAQNGVCNAVHVADVDGDGHDEIVTLGELPGYDGTGQASTVRIADADNGSEQWIGTLPGYPSVDSYVDFDVGNLGHGSDRDIVLTGYPATGGGSVVSILNGATHAIAARATPALTGANLVTGVRVVPVSAPPYVILIDANDYNVRSLHLLYASSLQEFWSSGPITYAQPAYQSDLDIAQIAGDTHPHAIVPAVLNGVYSWDLVTGTQDYNVPGSAMLGVVLPPLNGVTRYAYFDTAVPDRHAIKVIDAATGAALDEIAPVPEMLKLAADPLDPQRVIVEDADFIYAIRLDAHRIEAQSPHVAAPPLVGRSLIVRVRDGVQTVYAGTAMGVSAFRLVPAETPIFRNGFDPF